ncbi:MAG: hypothetical protein K8U03_15235 [Planctomycetia bacterium]|nr:hypothetical protein [Planctomycetia bacterium]
MPFLTDATFVQHRIDEAFNIDHGKAEPLRDRYHGYHKRAAHHNWHGGDGIHVLPIDDTGRLISVVFTSSLDVEAETFEEQVRRLKTALAAMLSEGEECHLFIDDHPQIDNATRTVSYTAKGFIERVSK